MMELVRAAKKIGPKEMEYLFLNKMREINVEMIKSLGGGDACIVCGINYSQR